MAPDDLIGMSDRLDRSDRRVTQLELDNKELRSSLLKASEDEVRMLDEHSKLIEENERLKVALESCGIRRVTTTGKIVLTPEATKKMDFPYPPEKDL